MISYEHLCMEIERWHSLQATENNQAAEHQQPHEEPEQHDAESEAQLSEFDALATGAFPNDDDGQPE